MVRSMTGFGRGEAVRGSYHVTVEVRTVNHRYLDTSVRLPKSLAGFEEKLRSLVQGRLGRGRVEVQVALEESGEGHQTVKVDVALARRYHAALSRLQQELGLVDQPTLAALVDMPGVLVTEETIDVEALSAALEEAADGALAEVQRMREAEGRRLAADLSERVGLIEEALRAIETRAPEVSQEFRQRLEARIREALGEVPVDEARLLQEVAIVADRGFIAEEIVRLRSHLVETRATLAEEAAVGRKLDFLLQEMNREINTIGSKANDVAIARQVISVKAELEKIREQVQNLE